MPENQKSTFENQINERIIALEIASMHIDFAERIKEIEIECALSPWTIEDYKNEANRAESIFLVAKLGNKIDGFLLAGLITNSTIANNIKDSKGFTEAEIYNFAISIENQGSGIGQNLFEAFLKQALQHSVSNVWLEVRESNHSAIRFYRRNGFQEIQMRKNFYSFPVDNCIVMKLNMRDFSE
jgi:ribosomal-protein-alanine N-acetyltransferase